MHAVEGGPRGDLLGDWTTFDVDHDQIAGMPWPRLRLVRQVPAAALATGVETTGWAEVCWALLPDPEASGDERALGVLWRGERGLHDAERLSFFDEGFFGPSGKPVPGSLDVVTGGVLWFEVWYATQTTIVHDGWQLGDSLADCSASWDAWSKGRPSPERSFFNQPPAGMPVVRDLPVLPRRVRLVLELERPEDLRFRTRLAAELATDATFLDVRDGRRLPAKDTLLLIGEEWMRVVSVAGERVSVERGQRGTRAVAHPKDALLHHGWPLVREIPVAMTREDWDL